MIGSRKDYPTWDQIFFWLSVVILATITYLSWCWVVVDKIVSYLGN